MRLHLALVGTMIVGLLGSSPVRAQEDPVGTLTFDGPAAAEHHVLMLTSLYFGLLPVGHGTGDDAAASHTVTMTSSILAPDAALLIWAMGTDKTRHCTIEIRDDPDVKPGSVIELDGASVSGLTVGYGGGGRGQQTLEVTAEHMRINGQTVY